MKDFLSRISSRSFIVMILSTVLLIAKIIDQNVWLVTVGLFLGKQASDNIAKIKGNKNDL